MYKKPAILVFMSLLFIMGGCSMSTEKIEEVKKSMTEYLKKTYDREFVVEKPKLTGNEGFG